MEESNKMQIFQNPEFGEVRTMLDENSDVLLLCDQRKCPCGTSDVATALGYSNIRGTLQRHCRGVLKRYAPTSSGEQEFSWIYEPDIYRLIIKSKLPAAESFESWLFTEVLPSIRKHGIYLTKDTVANIFNDPYKFKEAMDGFLAEVEKNRKLQKELDEAKPKVDVYNRFIDGNSLLNFRDTAKELNVKPTLFIQILLEKGYLYRSTRGDLRPYQPYVLSGLFQMKEFFTHNYAGTCTLVTPKGREHFMKLFDELTEEDFW
ncbi:MAG: phage antirepressor KilAC domain-containing protein [Eubacteriales bacterium]